MNHIFDTCRKHFLLLNFLFIITGCSNQAEKNTNSKTAPIAERKPNIIVILTDQERYPTHWPEGWAEKNLSF